jgi:hypothetical protein
MTHQVHQVQQVLRVLLVLLLTGGCGRSAPPVPFALSYATKDAAVEAFLAALRARDRDTLAAQVLTETEFLKYVWPQLPASRPDVGMPAERAWADQAQKNDLFLTQTLAEHGGRRCTLLAVSFEGAATAYESFTIHPGTRLDIREGSEAREVRLFGSMIESGGRWKIYSFVVD